MEPVSFELTIKKGDYSGLYLWAGYIRGYRIAATILATLLSAALLALLILSLAVGIQMDTTMGVLFAMPAAIMLFFLASILLTAAKAYRSSGLAGGGRCKITPAEIVFETPDLQIAITPDKIRKIYFKRKHIYIALPGTKYYIIPRSCIPEEQYDTALGCLEALG